MKKTGIALIIIGFLFAVSRGAYRMYSVYEYKNTIGSNWTLADRASTISRKYEYIYNFVKAFEEQGLSGEYDAIFLKTPNESFNENFKALKSLQFRLKEIQGMNPNSFEYQTALHQITEQEQGQANNMLDVLSGCWQKKNYYTLWNPILIFTFTLLQIGLIFLGWIIFYDAD